jgi:hypothetical protein
MATILNEWRPGDLPIDILRFCGIVARVGGILLFLLVVLGGSPEHLKEKADVSILGIPSGCCRLQLHHHWRLGVEREEVGSGGSIAWS